MAGNCTVIRALTNRRSPNFSRRYSHQILPLFDPTNILLRFPAIFLEFSLIFPCSFRTVSLRGSGSSATLAPLLESRRFSNAEGCGVTIRHRRPKSYVRHKRAHLKKPRRIEITACPQPDDFLFRPTAAGILGQPHCRAMSS